MSTLTKLAKAILKLDVRLHALKSTVYQRLSAYQHKRSASVLATACADNELAELQALNVYQQREDAAYAAYSRAVAANRSNHTHALADAEVRLQQAQEAADKHSALWSRPLQSGMTSTTR
jgi:ribosomal protein L15E